MLQKEFGKGFIFGECSPNIDLQKKEEKSQKKKVFLALFLMELCKDGRRRIFDLFFARIKKVNAVVFKTLPKVKTINIVD